MTKDLCPVCGLYAYEEKYDICPICGWENDPVQASDHDYMGGANKISVNQAKHFFEVGKSLVLEE